MRSGWIIRGFLPIPVSHRAGGERGGVRVGKDTSIVNLALAFQRMIDA